MVDGAKRRQARLDAKDYRREVRRRPCAWVWTEYGENCAKLVRLGRWGLNMTTCGQSHIHRREGRARWQRRREASPMPSELHALSARCNVGCPRARRARGQRARRSAGSDVGRRTVAAILRSSPIRDAVGNRGVEATRSRPNRHRDAAYQRSGDRHRAQAHQLPSNGLDPKLGVRSMPDSSHGIVCRVRACANATMHAMTACCSSLWAAA